MKKFITPLRTNEEILLNEIAKQLKIANKLNFIKQSCDYAMNPNTIDRYSKELETIGQELSQ